MGKAFEEWLSKFDDSETTCLEDLEAAWNAGLIHAAVLADSQGEQCAGFAASYPPYAEYEVDSERCDAQATVLRDLASTILKEVS